MNYLLIIKPVVMGLAKTIIVKLGRSPLEREYAEALVATVDVAESAFRRADTPEQHAAVLNELEDVVVELVKSRHGQGGLDKYRAARK